MRYELRAARGRVGYDLKGAGELLGITKQAYRKKELTGKFSDEQKLILIEKFELSYEQFNTIFYGGKLPWKNWPNLQSYLV